MVGTSHPFHSTHKHTHSYTGLLEQQLRETSQTLAWCRKLGCSIPTGNTNLRRLHMQLIPVSKLFSNNINTSKKLLLWKKIRQGCNACKYKNLKILRLRIRREPKLHKNPVFFQTNINNNNEKTESMGHICNFYLWNSQTTGFQYSLERLNILTYS